MLHVMFSCTFSPVALKLPILLEKHHSDWWLSYSPLHSSRTDMSRRSFDFLKFLIRNTLITQDDTPFPIESFLLRSPEFELIEKLHHRANLRRKCSKYLIGIQHSRSHLFPDRIRIAMMTSLPFRKSVSCLFNSVKSIRFSQASRNDYESAYNLKNLYPESSLKISTPQKEEIPTKKNQPFSGFIPMDKIKLKSSHASGPGGQHVNSSNTKVELRFHLASANWIPEDIRTRLLEKKKNQLTKEGEFILRSDKTRSYQMNVADVLQRLRTIIYNAHEPITEPDPEWEVTMRKRKEKANEERLRTKRHRSFLKRSRIECE